MGRSRYIAYPSRQVLAVLDSEAEAGAARDALADAGFEPAMVTLRPGPDGTAALDGLGTSDGPGGRLRRLLAFTVMDQLPDFILYERALRDGRFVLAVRAATENEKLKARDILRRHGAHFANYYGRFATEELDLWRGPEPDMPGVLRR
jgi:hypothetical protein